MQLYLNQIPTPEAEQRIILAGDHTPWPRTEAPALRDRTYEQVNRDVLNSLKKQLILMLIRQILMRFPCKQTVQSSVTIASS